MSKRKQETKEQKRTIPTVIGAGITEQYYFTHLKGLLNLKIRVQPRYFGREDIFTIEKRIKEVIDGGGVALCAFDADVTACNQTEKHKMEALKQKYEKHKRVILCDSMPSVEYWFLLHYKHTNKHFANSEAVIKELRRYIADFDKVKAFLEEPKWVSDMSSEGKLTQAKERATKFGTEGQSYTNLHKAFEYLGI